MRAPWTRTRRSHRQHTALSCPPPLSVLSQVHGTFFKQPTDSWKERHDRSDTTPPAQTFQDRLYPISHSSPWETTQNDMVPASKFIGNEKEERAGVRNKPLKPREAPEDPEPDVFFEQKQHFVGGTSIY